MGAAVLSIVVGLWLMVSPAFLHMSQQAANNNHMTGPLAVTFAVVSLWEINRNVIRVNLLVGAWVLVSLLVLPYSAFAVLLSNGFSGLALLLFSLKKRTAKKNFGGGWQSLIQHNPPHLQAAEKESLRPKP